MTRHAFLEAIDALDLVRPYGEVRSVTSGRIAATGPGLPIGSLCVIGSDRLAQVAEVASLSEDGIVLVSLDPGCPMIGDRVVAFAGGESVGVGDRFSGRAIDALGRPLDDRGAIVPGRMVARSGTIIAPLSRIEPRDPLDTGIRAIDTLLTLARGQRIGVFAASGVGKTSLIEQLAGQIDADRVILCLVGERGREVEGFWRKVSSRADSDRFTIVAATSDESAPMRVRAGDTALCLAEHWRDAGEHVLVVIDSVTRLAMALREIGLAAGEPPTMRAYTPNVFTALPRVVERCGSTEHGSITAVMTILSETDDVDDPIVEVMKSLLDGHIVLSRTLAERGHFPAIDVTRSISRLAARVTGSDDAATAREIFKLLSIYDESRLLIESGMYKSGSNIELDRAIACRDALMKFLRQRRDETTTSSDAFRALRAVVSAGGRHA